MRPLWDIQGWSRDGLISDALQDAFEIPSDECLGTALCDLLQEIRQRED